MLSEQVQAGFFEQYRKVLQECLQDLLESGEDIPADYVKDRLHELRLTAECFPVI